MFRVHNINTHDISIRNLILLFLTIVLGFASVITLGFVEIPSVIDNARQTIAKVTITEDGTNNMPVEMEISSGGMFINPLILPPQTAFSGKVLGIDDLGRVIYIFTEDLVVSGAGGGMGGGDGLWTGILGGDIYNLNTNNVGIGTSSMSGKLHVTSAGNTDVYIEDTNTGSAANINFKNTVNRWMVGGYSDRFYIGLDGIAFVNVIPSGYVGIGTTGPKAPLQVIGNFIAGEYSNNISGTTSSIGGGRNNIITGNRSFIGGGYGNKISGNDSTIVVGGEKNNQIINANNSFIGAGQGNIISGGQYCVIVGGADNNIYGSINSYGFIGGGYGNKIYTATNAFIGGGDTNIITGNSSYSMIPGGYDNKINNATYSFVAGVRAKANYNNSFVWNSDETSDFSSARTGTFIINVPWSERPDMGGVGINTADPQALLDVNGNSKIRGTLTVTGNIEVAQDIRAIGEVRTKNIEIDQRSSGVNSGASCGSENPGTIIYDGTGFYGCGPYNTRKRLD